MVVRHFPTLINFLLVLSLPALSLGQGGPCKVLVTVGTVLEPSPGSSPYSRHPPRYPLPSLAVPVHGLSADSFIAYDGRDPLPVLSVAPDDSARRFVIVPVLWPGTAQRWSKRGPALAGGAEHGAMAEPITTAVRAILDKARPQDSFGLLCAVGPPCSAPLGSARPALQASLSQFAQAYLSQRSPSHTKVGRDVVLDAIDEAAGWFGPPQPGDAILLIGGFYRASRSKMRRVRVTLASRGIKLFLFGGGTYFEFSTLPMLYQNSPDLDLAIRTDGSNEEVGFAGPDATDENLWLWRTEAEALYDTATSGYVLLLPKTGPNVHIGVRGIEASVGHVHPLPVCP